MRRLVVERRRSTRIRIAALLVGLVLSVGGIGAALGQEPAEESDPRARVNSVQMIIHGEGLSSRRSRSSERARRNIRDFF